MLRWLILVLIISDFQYMRPGFVLSIMTIDQRKVVFIQFFFFVPIEMLKSDSCMLINLFSN